MPTPPMPPDVSGVGPNWYVDDNWTNVVIPNVTTAQNDYDAALAALNAFITTYTAKKEALTNFLNNNPLPADEANLVAIQAQLTADLAILNALNPSDSGYAAAKAQVQQDQSNLLAAQTTLNNDKQTLIDLRDAFDTAQTTYYTLLNALKAKSDALLAAYVAAASQVDTLTDAQLTQFATDLQGVMNKQLTLPATISSNLDTQFSTANSTRIAARAAFLTALSNFQSLQSQVSQASITYQTLSDQYLLSIAQVEIDTATLASYKADLAYHQAQLVIDTKEGNAAGIAQDNLDIAADNANIGLATAALAASQAAKATLASQVATQKTTLQNLISQRDAAQHALSTALSAYQNAIDAQIAILNQAAQIMQSVPPQFLEALIQARQDATATEQAFLQAAKAADEALKTQHFIDYPDVNPVVQAQIEQILISAFQTMQNINANLVKPSFVDTSQINLPQLPAAGHMSMTQLIQFLTLVSAFFSQLLREIRRTDSRVNEFRLTLFATSYGSQADATSRNMAWANTLQAQDSKYNQFVVLDNHNNSQHTVDQIQDIFDNIDAINAVIDQLNKEIDEQNARGIEVVTDYNSSVQMAIDNLKLQLYQDYGQLSLLADTLANDVNALLPSDPTKAPLLSVLSAVQNVLTDLKAISNDLSQVPINSVQLATDQAALAAHQVALTGLISALPPTISDSIQGDLSGITKQISIVTSDQGKLSTALQTAQNNAATGLGANVSGLGTVLSTYQTELAAYITSLGPTNPAVPSLNALNSIILSLTTDLTSVSTILNTQPVDFVQLAAAQTQLSTDYASLQTDPTVSTRLNLAIHFAELSQLSTKFASDLNEIAPSNPALQAVLAEINKVSDDITVVSNDLNTPPINFALLADHLALLATDKTALLNHISSLGSIDPVLSADLAAIVAKLSAISADHTALTTSIQTDLATIAAGFVTNVTNYMADLSLHIAGLPEADTDRVKVNTVLSNVAIVNNDLAAIQALLAVIPVDAEALATAQATLATDIATLKASIPTGQFVSPDVTQDLANISAFADDLLASDIPGPNPAAVSINFTTVFEALADIGTANLSIAAFLNAPTSTPIAFPGLPANAQTPLMAGPTQLQHYPRIDPAAYVIPASMPTLNLDFTVPPDIQGFPPLPSKADVDRLNGIVHQLNQLIVPLLPRLQAAGVDVSAIDPFYVRPYIPVRAPSNFFTFTSLLFIFLLIFIFLIGPLLKQQAESGKDIAGVTDFIGLANLLGNLPNTGAASSVQSTGSGTGLLGASLFNAPGNLGQALQAVVNSTAFQDFIGNILSQVGLIGGLSALTQLPTSINNWSEMGLVQSDASTAVGQVATDRILTAAQQAAIIAAITELVNTVTNVGPIKESLLAIIEGTGPFKLSDDELAQLISQLLFLIQLIGLLIAAILAAAAGGQVNIDNILEQAFKSSQDNDLSVANNNLQFLGVQNLPTVEPSNPTFLPQFLNAIVPQLDETERSSFTSRVSTIFSDRGITLETDVPLGTAVENALNRVGPDVAADIRRELNQAAFDEADRLRSQILSDETRRPVVVAQVTAEVQRQLGALPSETVQSITSDLERNVPQVTSLKPEEKNILILAIAKGLITPAQAAGFVNEFLREAATETTPSLALLVGITAVQTPTPSREPLTAGSPSQQPGTPGELSDTFTIIADAFRALSKQTDDEGFTQQATILFANLIRNQSDFFQKSLSLILNPANTYVKNFSIVTRDDSLPGSHPTISQIPIAG